MVIYKQAQPLHDDLQTLRKEGKRIGFIPTMGALHLGHLSLIGASKKSDDLSVSSIFVNPTQFNNREDFTNYPKTIEEDIEHLIRAGCDILFMPHVREIYPPGYQKRHYDLGPLENVLEGHFRPGHFQGVCEVVDRLLSVIEPTTLYLGQKDYQQCMVIRRLLQLTGRTSTELRIGPTQREADGLAMSSRNLRLDSDAREKAPVLYQALSYIQDHLAQLPLEQLKAEARDSVADRGFKVDYVEIADARSLQPAPDRDRPLVALIAASIHNIRLIDNLELS